MSVYVLNTTNGSIPVRASQEYEKLEEEVERAENFLSSFRVEGSKKSDNKKSPYTKVQTLSFQIYTGGAPAFTVDETTGEEKKNHECKGCK